MTHYAFLTQAAIQQRGIQYCGSRRGSRQANVRSVEVDFRQVPRRRHAKQQIHAERDDTDANRRARVFAREKCRGEDLYERKADQPDRVGAAATVRSC